MEMIQAKGLRILKNIKTMWISMLAPFKQMHNEYKTFMVKMVKHGASIPSVKTNYELLCDVEIIMGLTCVLSTVYRTWENLQWQCCNCVDVLSIIIHHVCGCWVAIFLWPFEEFLGLGRMHL
jgi:hypothetical protein